MSKYDSINAGFSGEKKALPEGTYGSGTEAGLQVVHYIGARPTKDKALNRHSFLVASTNGIEGTAFLAIQLKDEWLDDGTISLAFNNPDSATEEERKAAEKRLYLAAVERAKANGADEENIEEAAQDTYKKLLTQIKVSIGQMFRLQDWKGVERDPFAPIAELVGIEFAGTIKPGLTESTSEVDSIFSKKKAKSQ
jgi:hypothetical protein